MANYKTTLKDNKKENNIYPQTTADIVLTSNGTTVESALNTLSSDLQTLKDKDLFVGYYKNENELLSAYPNGISNSKDREGLYARVGGVESNDSTIYFWDVEGNKWLKSEMNTLYGASSVNGIEANDEGNVSLNSTHIPTTFNDNLSVQEHLALDKQEISSIKSTIETLESKTNVLYLTSEQFTNGIYENGQTAVSIDENETYKLGSIYKYSSETSSWEEITASGTEITDTLTLSKEVFVPAQPERRVDFVSIETLTNPSNYQFVLGDDGYYTNNTNGQYGYVVCKFTFNVLRDSDVVFDAKNIGEQGYDFGTFSNLDAELMNNDNADVDFSPNNVFYDFKQATTNQLSEKQIVYKNVPAGQHFITVKWKGDGGEPEYNYIKFKLNNELNNTPGIPEHYRTSTQSIKVSDNNTLQIDNKDILKQGDITEPIKKLIGTEGNPVILYDLEPGFYTLTGYFKYNNADEYKKRVVREIFKNNQWVYEISSVLMQIHQESENLKPVSLYNASFYNGESADWLVLSMPNYMLLKLQRSGGIYEWSEYALGSINNKVDYMYVDRKVAELNSKVDAIEIISSLDNPTNLSYEYENKLVNSTDTSNKAIYYGKKIGEEIANVPLSEMEVGFLCDSFYIDKNAILSANGLGASNGFYPFNISLNYDENSAWTHSSAYVVNDGYGNPSAFLFFNTIYDTSILGWASTNYFNPVLEPYTEGNYINYLQYIKDNDNSSINYIKITGKDTTNSFPEYVFTRKLVPTIEAVELALKSDIGSGSGGSGELASQVNEIESKIPTQASSTNQLADKEFVNSSISTHTADFKGTFSSTTELPTTNVNINDYAFVTTTDDNGNTLYNRYKYNSSNEWVFEYSLNNSSFTANQWSSINSGITSDLVGKISTNETNISDLQTSVSTKANDSDVIKKTSSSTQIISTTGTQFPLRIKTNLNYTSLIGYVGDQDTYVGALGLKRYSNDTIQYRPIVDAEGFTTFKKLAYLEEVLSVSAKNSLEQEYNKVANILDYHDYMPSLSNGVTCTLNDDYSIHINGTLTGQQYFSLTQRFPLSLKSGQTIKLQQYTFDLPNLRIKIYNTDNTSFDIGVNTAHTLTKDTYEAYLYSTDNAIGTSFNQDVRLTLSVGGFETNDFAENKGNLIHEKDLDDYATLSDIPTNYVTTTTAQEISGAKTFNDDVSYKETTTFYNSNQATTSAKCFGLYQWDDKFQYTYRNASNNTYQGTAFEIDGNNGITDYKSRPTVNGSQVALKTDIPSVPTKTSQLTNDSNFSTFSGSYNDLTDKPTIPTIPTNISAFTNDSNYATTSQVDNKINKTAFTLSGTTLTINLD